MRPPPVPATIAGRVAAIGPGSPVSSLASAWACHGSARPAALRPTRRSERENLCDHAVFTGYTRDGGYATHILADPIRDLCFPLLDAPKRRLLCAGLIGWRCYRLPRLAVGLYGFGAAAHSLAGRRLARPAVWHSRVRGTLRAVFRASLGAVWAGVSRSRRRPLDASNT